MQVTITTIRDRVPGSKVRKRRLWVWDDGVVEVEPAGDDMALQVVRDLPNVDGDDLRTRMLALDGRNVGYSTITTSTMDLPAEDRQPIPAGSETGPDEE